MTYVLGKHSLPPDLVVAIPNEDPGVLGSVWNDKGVLMINTAGPGAVKNPEYIGPWRQNPNWAPRLERWPSLFSSRKRWMRPRFIGGFDYATDVELARIQLEERFGEK